MAVKEIVYTVLRRPERRNRNISRTIYGCLILLLQFSYTVPDGLGDEAKCLPHGTVATNGSIGPQFLTVYRKLPITKALLYCCTANHPLAPVMMGNIHNLHIDKCDASIAERISGNATIKMKLTNAIGDDRRRLTRNHFTAGAAELLELHIWNSVNSDTIEPGAFDHMTGLVEITLQYNSYLSMPTDLLAKLGNLRNFTMAGWKNVTMETLPERFFAGLLQLQKVIVISCGLKNLHINLFDGSWNITYIALTGNDLIELPRGIFNGLVNLSYLMLNKNKLIHLDDGIFASLRSLKVLWMDNNHMTEISS